MTPTTQQENSSTRDEQHDFWWHLDELRGVLLKIVIAVVACAAVAFCFKEEVFSIVLAPKEADFATYRFLSDLCLRFGLPPVDSFEVNLINTGLAQQFIVHMKTALCVGLLCVSPFIIYQIFSFVAPGLYSSERRIALRVVWSGYFMFILGVLLDYFLIFPLTFRFLGTYQVASDVTNLISLDSYMSTLIIMSLWLGVMFELPVIAWILAKTGILRHSMLRDYRQHAIVIILIIAAIITPTSDVVTLLLVSLPIYILYEISILIVRQTEKHSGLSSSE